MSFKIKDLKQLLNEVTELNHVTDESDIIMATGAPAKGGAVYLVVASGFAQREENCSPAETTLFLEIKTVAEVNALIAQGFEKIPESVIDDEVPVQ